MKNLLLFAFFLSSCTRGFCADQINASAPLFNDSAAGTNIQISMSAVVHIFVKKNDGVGTGTGFLLKNSGRVITAAHVVAGADVSNVVAVIFNKKTIAFTNLITDTDSDIAVLQPSAPVELAAVELRRNISFKIGTQYSIWGFPGGYNGLDPLFSVGYLSGLDASPGWKMKRMVINGAINLGNSGGPLIGLDDGKVLGMVVSKVAPLPQEIETVLAALKNNPGGVIYTAKRSDGTEVSFSEAQLSEKVLQFLRSQTQLVIGHAVTSDEIIDFLEKNKIDP